MKTIKEYTKIHQAVSAVPMTPLFEARWVDEESTLHGGIFQKDGKIIFDVEDETEEDWTEFFHTTPCVFHPVPEDIKIPVKTGSFGDKKEKLFAHSAKRCPSCSRNSLWVEDEDFSFTQTYFCTNCEGVHVLRELTKDEYDPFHQEIMKQLRMSTARYKFR